MSDLQKTLYLLADELRGIASWGRHFDKDVYALERAQRVMEIAAQLAALADEQPLEIIKEIFEKEPWLRLCPIVGVDAAVFNDKGEILLIQRADNQLWCMPGGSSEIGHTFPEMVLRELWEEAGLRGQVERLIGVFDGRLWGSRSPVHSVILTFLVSCNDLSPSPGLETLDAKFFPKDQLPPLHGGHSLRVPKIFELRNQPTYFDAAESYTAEMPMKQRTK